jgi:hypothetical protein
MSEEPRKIYLGTISVEEGEATPVFDIPLDADPEVIRAAIQQAEEEKIAAQIRETKRLRELFPIESEHHVGVDKADEQ